MFFIRMDSPQSNYKVSYIDFGTHQLSQFVPTKIRLLLPVRPLSCSVVKSAVNSFIVLPLPVLYRVSVRVKSLADIELVHHLINVG
jgi:hypothetical protein